MGGHTGPDILPTTQSDLGKRVQGTGYVVCRLQARWQHVRTCISHENIHVFNRSVLTWRNNPQNTGLFSDDRCMKNS